ncbi:MAG: YerC/YecD family TrpR-related protein [Patescibacteria group bacterium]
MTWKTPKLKNLAKTLLSIKNESNMLAFLRDLCTLEELEVISSRWEAARMIKKGSPYRKIAEKTGISTATVTRIAHWIRHGEGGYKKLLGK